MDEILRPMWPDLPMPVTSTRPRHFLISSMRGDEALPERAADRRSQRGHAARFGIQCAAAPNGSEGVLGPVSCLLGELG